MKRLAVPLVLVAAASSAGAFVSSAALVATRAGSAIQVTAPATGLAVAASARTISAGATTGEAKIIDMLRAAGPAGDLPLTVSRTVTASSISAGLARVASRVSVPLAVGMTAYDLLKSAGIRQGSSSAEIDIGNDQVDKVETEYSCHMGSQYASKSNSLSGCAEQIVSKAQANADSKLNPAPLWSGNQTRTVDTYSLNLCGSSYCWIKSTKQTQERFCSSGVCAPWKNTGPLTTNDSNLVEASSKTVTTKSCPEIIDSLTGQSYVPGQYSDGKCISGAYSTATESQVIARVQPAVQSDPVTSTRAVLDSGGYIDSEPMSISGPQSQSGTPQTTTVTGPSGQISTTRTPTYNYTYNGDTITYNTVNNTTTTQTNTEGQTTTETKTETEPPDTKQLCDLFPSALACMKVGDIPEPDKLPENVKAVAPGRHSAWSYNSGQCPNRTIDFSFGVSVNILQPFCDFFVILKGVILSIFSLASALVFRGGIR